MTPAVIGCLAAGVGIAAALALFGAAALLVEGLLAPAVARALDDVLDRTRRALGIDAPR